MGVVAGVDDGLGGWDGEWGLGISRWGQEGKVGIWGWGKGWGKSGVGFDNFLLFWGIGGLGVVSGMVCGHGGWGGQREL